MKEIQVVGDIADVNAVRCPDLEAVVEDERSLSWRELNTRVSRLAQGLRNGMGLSALERVSIISDNRLEYFETFHALARAHLIAAPLNNRLSQPELEVLVGQVVPRIIFHSRECEEIARHLSRLTGAQPISFDGDGEHTYNDLLRSHPAGPSWPPPVAQDPSSICFTGGTTGVPKGAVLSHGALVAFGRVVRIAHGVREGDRHVMVRPMSVAPGHRMAAWHGYYGGTTVIAGSFEPERFLRAVETHAGTVALLNPTMLQMLMDHGGLTSRHIATLRAVTYGGAPITPALLGQVVEMAPFDLHQNCGGTETATAFHLTPEDHRAGRLESIGREAPEVVTKIVDESGCSVPDLTAGELWVKSPMMMSGYWNNDKATRDVMHEGFCARGDLVVRDASGYVKLVGRTKDLIISGGYNVYPVEVENVLASHSSVREVAVIGVPDATWGESVLAIVVPREGARATEEELIQFCRTQIASYKKPRAVEIVDALPRTALGKVAKDVLRHTYSGHVQAAGGKMQRGPRM